MTTPELTKRLNELTLTLERNRLDRHASNNRLQGILSNITERITDSDQFSKISMIRMETLQTEFASLKKAVEVLQFKTTELDHLMRGVDGTNGMRAELAAIRIEQQSQSKQMRFMEVKIAGLVAFFIGAGYAALKAFGV